MDANLYHQLLRSFNKLYISNNEPTSNQVPVVGPNLLNSTVIIDSKSYVAT